MIEQAFEYLKVKSVKEASKLLKGKKEVRLLAGGTDLICNIKENREQVALVLDLKGIEALSQLKMVKDTLTIGALVTFDRLIDSPIVRKYFPVLMEMGGMVASPAIRNRATMVGNICSAVPCMDSAGPLLCYEAKVVVEGLKKREVPIEKWFLAPRKTAIKKGELVTGVKLKKIKHGGVYLKHGRYSGEDLAQGSVTVLALPKGEIRVAFGSLGPVPTRAKKIEALLKGKRVDEVLISDCEKLVEKEICPITDIRSTKEYRMHMAKVMLKRGIVAAIERLNNKGPKYGTNLV